MAKGSTPYVAGLLSMFNPPSEVPEIPQEEACFAALGRFIASYASAEHALHTLARKLTRLTDAKARIIFNGMRLGDLAERIRGILRVTKASDKKYTELDECLIQLDLIAEQRNKLVHRWVHYINGRIVASNVATAKVLDSSEVTFFSIDVFENMKTDCLAITFRLMNLEKKMNSRETLKWARSPWRYKPAQLDHVQRPHRKHPQLPKRRHLSSRERREAAMKVRK